MRLAKCLVALVIVWGAGGCSSRPDSYALPGSFCESLDYSGFATLGGYKWNTRPNAQVLANKAFCFTNFDTSGSIGGVKTHAKVTVVKYGSVDEAKEVFGRLKKGDPEADGSIETDVEQARYFGSTQEFEILVRDADITVQVYGSVDEGDFGRSDARACSTVDGQRSWRAARSVMTVGR